MTMGEVVAQIVERLNRDDLEGACDVMDQTFIQSWLALMDESGPLRPGEKRKALKDLRGVVVGVYQLAKQDFKENK